MSIEGDADGALPRSYLRVALLAALAAGPAHGYDLLEQVRDLGVRVADPGGLYRALRAMERDGLVASWWEDSQYGPPRRTYQLAPEGRAELANEAVALRRTMHVLAALVQVAETSVGAAERVSARR